MVKFDLSAVTIIVPLLANILSFVLSATCGLSELGRPCSVLYSAVQCQNRFSTWPHGSQSTRLRCSFDPCTAAKKTKEYAAFTLGIPVRLSTQINFRRINFAGPGLSICGEYSTVQHSTVQYS